MSARANRAGPAEFLPARVGIALAAPAACLLAVAFLWPVALFLARSLEGPTPFASFARIAESGIYLGVLVRTLIVAFSVTGLCLVLAYPIAWLLARLRGWRQGVLAVFVLLPLWTSVLVRSFAWTVLLQRRGLVNEMLLSAGLIEQPLTMLYTTGAVIVAMAHVLLPFLILPLWNSLRQIDPDYARAALVMGAGGWLTFRRVTLPLSAPGAAAGCLFVFALSLGFFITPQLVGGPRAMMIGTLISQQAIDALNWPFAAALSLLVTIIAVALLPFSRRLFLEREREPVR